MPQANGFALPGAVRAVAAPWYPQDEGVRPGVVAFRSRYWLLSTRAGSDLGEVSTQQREMVTLINAADATDAGQKRIVTGVPSGA